MIYFFLFRSIFWVGKHGWPLSEQIFVNLIKERQVKGRRIIVHSRRYTTRAWYSRRLFHFVASHHVHL